MKMIHANNSPNLFEYVVSVVFLLGLSVFSFTYTLLWVSISIVVVLVLYSKRTTVILDQQSLEIHLKIGMFTYSKISPRFTNVTSNEDTIRFYDNDTLVLKLDITIAPEENEAHDIALWSARKNTSLGNKRNYLRLFNEIKQFYTRQD